MIAPTPRQYICGRQLYRRKAKAPPLFEARPSRGLCVECLEARRLLTGVEFFNHLVAETTTLNPTSVYSADLDGDGDLDLLSASLSDDKIAWYENTNGAGSFGEQRTITTQADGAFSVYAADLDGDGDLDVASASQLDNKIAWYENTDGAGSFGPQNVVTDEAASALSVHAADLDGDGDQDLLSASASDNTVGWFENADGMGNFGPRQVITSSAPSASSVYAADVDGDGDADVVTASLEDNRVAWYENTNGRGAFGSRQVITTNAVGARSVYVADLDGDRDLDVLSASTGDHKVAWYENIDGAGGFGPQRIITDAAGGASTVYAADIDGDGDLDVLCASQSADTVAWYENTDGMGTFGSQQTINSTADTATSAYAADLDGDGDLDVVSASFDDHKIAWYENTDGAGTFARQVVARGSDIPYSAVAADVDGDGDLDALYTSPNDDKVAWHENIDGNGVFGPEHVITASADGAFCVHAADLDGDGDTDVLTASAEDDTVAWYENTDGVGTFGVRQVISTTAHWATSVYASDIDNDGDLDVISASMDDSKIAWYENRDGLGTFGSERVITTDAVNARSVYAADLDGDGDRDVLSASWYGVAWYENTDGTGTFGRLQYISTPSVLFFMESVYAADLDGDGDQDVLSASEGDGLVAWHENTDGAGTFGPRRGIVQLESAAEDVYAADMDDDGDLDVVSAFSGVAWHENTDGAGTFGRHHWVALAPVGARSAQTADMDGDGDLDVLLAAPGIGEVSWSENTDGVGTFGAHVVSADDARACSAFPADIDGDGDLDLLSSSSSFDQIGWYENADGEANFGPQQILATNAGGPCDLQAADLDFDGDLDVLAAAPWLNSVTWYENLDGEGSFGPMQSITDSADYAFSAHAADLDGDGDLDVLSASMNDDKIAWYENLGGAGNFGPQLIITTGADGAWSVHAADVDGDGDLDVLSASMNDDTIAWYENTNGDGTFGPRRVITTSADRASFVYAADLDGDGDQDVLSASGADNKIAWYENTDGGGTFGPQQVITTSAGVAFSVYAEDMDDDGDMDVLSASNDDHKIAWYENTDGQGTFGEQQIIATTADARTVYAADMDGDGDIDAVSASWGSVAWHENVPVANSPPTMSEFTDRTMDEDSSTGPIDFTLADADTPIQSLIVTAASGNQTLIPDANIHLSGTGADRSIEIVPAADSGGGPVAISVTVSDGTDETTGSFLITVLAVNDRPTLSAVADQTLPEDGSSEPIVFTVSDLETAADLLTVTATSSDQGLFPDATLVLGGSHGDRTITLQPAANQHGGPVTVTLLVDDATDSAARTFQVTVTSVNDAPTVIAPIGDITIAGGTPNTMIDLSTVFEDVDSVTDNQSLTYEIRSNGNPSLVSGSISDSILWLDFVVGQTGQAQFVVRATDSGLPSLFVEETFDVFVITTNEPPTISDIPPQATLEDTSIPPIVFTIADAETAPNELAITAVSHNPTLIPDERIGLGGNGADRTLSIEPTENESGTATITVLVSDGDGGIAETTLNVVVEPVNDPPFNTVAETQVVRASTSVVFSVSNGNSLRIHDVDAGQSDISVMLEVDEGVLSVAGTASLTNAVGNGSASVHLTGTQAAINAALEGLTYVAEQDFAGTITLTITTDDLGNTGSGGAGSDTDSIDLIFNPPNRPPRISSSETVEVPELTTAVLVVRATDPDGDVLGFSIIGGADQTAFSIDSSSGALQFVSQPDFEDPGDTNSDNVYEVQVLASDGQTEIAIQLIQVSVLDVDEIGPNVRVVDVPPDPRAGGVDEIHIVFSEAIRGFDLEDLTLTRSTDETTPIPLGSATLTTDDNISWSMGKLGTVTSAAGRYHLQVAETGSLITDLAGIPLVAGTSEWWINGPGDANGDGQFDQFDLIKVLQARKYRSGDSANWAEGDWNGDDRFDQFDLISAQRTQPPHYRQGPFTAISAERNVEQGLSDTDGQALINVSYEEEVQVIESLFARLSA